MLIRLYRLPYTDIDNIRAQCDDAAYRYVEDVKSYFRLMFFFFFSSRRRHTRFDCHWSSDVCSSDLAASTAPHHGCESCVSSTTNSPDPCAGWSERSPSRGHSAGLDRAKSMTPRHVSSSLQECSQPAGGGVSRCAPCRSCLPDRSRPVAPRETGRLTNRCDGIVRHAAWAPPSLRWRWCSK